ncbi:MAG: CNP1-like family protein [Gammaproteobacteria bacterium]
MAAPYEFEFTDPKPWEETGKTLPAYPQDADLLPLDIRAPGSSFKFFIDSKSLLVTDDNIVSYTLVISSDSGAKNVVREGLRCGFDEYKLYAYGNSDGSFQATKEAGWKSIPNRGFNTYQKDLLDYMCDSNMLPLQPKQILNRIRYPQTISQPRR